ncbi:MAG: hypothetical protein ACREA2_14645 [Blastocatellia bacterium]
MKTPPRRVATIEREQSRLGITPVLARGRKINRRYATREHTRAYRGLKPTAKFKPSLRDEENAPFMQRPG